MNLVSDWRNQQSKSSNTRNTGYHTQTMYSRLCIQSEYTILNVPSSLLRLNRALSVFYLLCSSLIVASFTRWPRRHFILQSSRLATILISHRSSLPIVSQSCQRCRFLHFLCCVFCCVWSRFQSVRWPLQSPQPQTVKPFKCRSIFSRHGP